MASRGLFVKLIGDKTSLAKAVRSSQTDLKNLGVSAEASARTQIAASLKKDARLREEVAAYRAVALAAEKGSREQIIAANLAARAQAKLSKSLGVTAVESRAFAASASHAERDIGRATRGALAGSGVFSSLGRSLAFASGSFLSFAAVTKFLRDSIDASQEAIVAQKSLAAQMKASGESFKANQAQIEKVSRSYSKFGFQNDEVIASLTVLERGTGNINKAFRLQGLVADLARAKNLRLTDAAATVAKVFGGQETALRRAVPGLQKNAHGWDLIREAQGRLAGQAAANTTAAERFNASLHDTQEIIGTALLPSLNKILDRLSKWMANTEHQAQLQAVANDAARVGATVFSSLADAVSLSAAAYGKLNTAFKQLPGNNGSLIKALFGATPPGQTLDLLNRLRHAFDQFDRGDFASGVTGTPGGGDFGGGIGGLGGTIQGLLGGGGSGTRKPRSLAGQFNLADLRLARAQLTATTADDRRILVIEAAITRQQIEQSKKLKERIAFTKTLAGILDQIRGIDQQAADNAKAQAQAAKERAKAAEAVRRAFTVPLGLQVAEARAGALGKDDLGTSILKKIRSTAQRALKSGRLGLQGQLDAWNTIADINDRLKNAGDVQTKFMKANLSKITAGFALSAADRKKLESRLSVVGPGGTVPHRTAVAGGFGGQTLVIHHTTKLDGKVVEQSTTKHQQKRRRSNPPQKRGPHAGGI